MIIIGKKGDKLKLSCIGEKGNKIFTIAGKEIETLLDNLRFKLNNMTPGIIQYSPETTANGYYLDSFNDMTPCDRVSIELEKMVEEVIKNPAIPSYQEEEMDMEVEEPV